MARKSIEEKIIALSRTKIILIIFMAMAFVALGCWLVWLDEDAILSSRRYHQPLIVHGVGVVTVIFFVVATIAGIRKMFDKKPGFIFNESGFTDNSGYFPGGEIAWSDYAGRDVNEKGWRKAIVIKFRDPQKYIEKASGLTKLVRRFNHQTYGSPVVVNPATLQISSSDFLDILDDYQKRYDSARVKHGKAA